MRPHSITDLIYKRIADPNALDRSSHATAWRLVCQDLLQDEVVLVAPLVSQEDLLCGAELPMGDCLVGQSVGMSAAKSLGVLQSERASLLHARSSFLCINTVLEVFQDARTTSSRKQML